MRLNRVRRQLADAVRVRPWLYEMRATTRVVIDNSRASQGTRSSGNAESVGGRTVTHSHPSSVLCAKKRGGSGRDGHHGCYSIDPNCSTTGLIDAHRLTTSLLQRLRRRRRVRAPLCAARPLRVAQEQPPRRPRVRAAADPAVGLVVFSSNSTRSGAARSVARCAARSSCSPATRRSAACSGARSTWRRRRASTTSAPTAARRPWRGWTSGTSTARCARRRQLAAAAAAAARARRRGRDACDTAARNVFGRRKRRP